MKSVKEMSDETLMTLLSEANEVVRRLDGYWPLCLNDAAYKRNELSEIRVLARNLHRRINQVWKDNGPQL